MRGLSLTAPGLFSRRRTPWKFPRAPEAGDGDVTCDNKNLCGRLIVHQAFHSSIRQTLSTYWVQDLLQASSSGEGGRRQLNKPVYK